VEADHRGEHEGQGGGAEYPVPVFNPFRFSRKEQDQRPSGATDVERFECLVQHQNSISFHP
jgi:hypothetical protein